jgi:CheY-like chemotaxis protein
MNISDWTTLLVDDEPDNLSVLELLLTFYDARVMSARSGQEALKLLAEHPFTLALVDIQMPGVSGWDIIKHIREHESRAVRTMFVVAVTAYAMAGDRERVLSAGFDGYISKPIDVTTFMRTLQVIVEARQVPEATVQSPSIAGENNDR